MPNKMETNENHEWDVVQLARHKDRPRFSDYLGGMIKGPMELHGDRCCGDDPVIWTGWGAIEFEKFMIVGQSKGGVYVPKNESKGEYSEVVRVKAGCPNPEGFRKALAKMKLAEKFGRPILSFIDTPGAYPGIGAEERGQAQAIAYNLMEMSRLKVPMISVVIGEGGSGGALGVMGWDKVYMLENSYLSVISPEGCAGILWKDGAKAGEAARALKPTAAKALELKVIDGIIDEPKGGAHVNHYETFKNVERQVASAYRELSGVPIEELVEKRYEKIRAIGTR